MTSIHRKVALAREGKYPNAIIQLPSGWVMLAETLPVPGYCIFMSDPVLTDINSAAESQRIRYWLDVCRIGDALLRVAGADRINYETWGNVDRALHTHITPRYLHEPEELRRKTPREAYNLGLSRAFDLNVDGELMEKLKKALS